MYERPHGLVVNLQTAYSQFIGKAVECKITAPDAVKEPFPVRPRDLGLAIASKLGWPFVGIFLLGK